jgi:starch synthase (maltosyl-transferring)
VIGRIPILDVQPVLQCDGQPAKAVAGETFQVTATVFREGHEMLGAAVVLTDPDGVDSPLAIMRELAPGLDRYGADVTPDRQGHWQFRVEAWGDRIAHWQHDAAIKIPIGQDVELMCAAGARLLERAREQIAVPSSPPAAGARARAAR